MLYYNVNLSLIKRKCLQYKEAQPNMDKKRVLIVTQEMQPYTALTEISETVSKLPQYLQDNGLEIRVLMPRFGTINERRHRLHEVVRLSGMNIIVNDDDYPLIIKVASLPNARLQVYFLDNDEFFKRKSVFEDDHGKEFEDNLERMVFFCKGAIETVKKFGWSPDIVHAHGWLTSLIPMYLRTTYRNEPIFTNSKIIYSLYDHPVTVGDGAGFEEKATAALLDQSDLARYQAADGLNVHAGALFFSDAVINGSTQTSPGVLQLLQQYEKPVLQVESTEDHLAAYMEFYHDLLGQEVE